MSLMPQDSEIVRLPEWVGEIRFALSLRQDGQMSFKRAPKEVVAANRKRFLTRYGFDWERVVAGELVHSAGIAVVTPEDVGRGAMRDNGLPGIDGMITTYSEVTMLTTHADCAPIVIYDRVKQVLGQAHAGWRGLRSGIIPALVDAMASRGAFPKRMQAWIGPTIGKCCYPVGPEVADQFPDNCKAVNSGQTRLDLPSFIQRELKALDLAPESITDSGICTSCNLHFSSYRRDGTATVAMALVTGLFR